MLGQMQGIPVPGAQLLHQRIPASPPKCPAGPRGTSCPQKCRPAREASPIATLPAAGQGLQARRAALSSALPHPPLPHRAGTKELPQHSRQPCSARACPGTLHLPRCSPKGQEFTLRVMPTAPEKQEMGARCRVTKFRFIVF